MTGGLVGVELGAPKAGVHSWIQRSICGPIVNQLRQDFGVVAAYKCDTHKALVFFDTPARDQEAGGSLRRCSGQANPLAPTIIHINLSRPSGVFIYRAVDDFADANSSNAEDHVDERFRHQQDQEPHP